jgi:hypothetical protein
MTLLAETISLPIGWILTSIGILCGTIATLTTTFYQFLKSRLAAQDKILSMQETQIDHLKAEVLRLSQGCGIESCHWRGAARVSPTLRQ